MTHFLSLSFFLPFSFVSHPLSPLLCLSLSLLPPFLSLGLSPHTGSIHQRARTQSEARERSRISAHKPWAHRHHSIWWRTKHKREKAYGSSEGVRSRNWIKNQGRRTFPSVCEGGIGRFEECFAKGGKALISEHDEWLLVCLLACVFACFACFACLFDNSPIPFLALHGTLTLPPPLYFSLLRVQVEIREQEDDEVVETLTAYTKKLQASLHIINSMDT